MPAVSIIIPVYNIGKYLEKCLDSVIAQTFPDIEIIVVNDGSTDNSPEIIARYADNDPVSSLSTKLTKAWHTLANRE